MTAAGAFFSFGPIPFLAVDAYARRFGPEGVDAFDRFAALIQGMDAEWRNHMNSQRGG